MREQLKSIGFALDWSRELATCDPAYYGHEQALFLDLFEAGLVYRKESEVNWDPVDMTVLANEQVIDGKGWRSGATVERRKLSQWFLKITDFADELLEGLKGLNDWPEKVRLMQENWIGKSRGLQFRFRLAEPVGGIDRVDVFTTRPDTIFGASFVAVAADHPIARAVAATNAQAAEFIAECKEGGTSAAEIETAEKKGFRTPARGRPPARPRMAPAGLYRELRADGLRHRRIVRRARPRPARFRICETISTADQACRRGEQRCRFRADRRRSRESRPELRSIRDFLDGLTSEQAAADVIRRAEAAGWGHGTVQYRLRDWGVSRQRYWGTPIPIIHCPTCGAVAVPREQLPVVLPDDIDFETPGNPLDRHPTWKHVDCPGCGGAATRETDTLDTFVDFELVFHPLRQPAGGQAVRPRRGRAVAACRPIYRRRRARDPAPALRAVLDPGAAEARPHRSPSRSRVCSLKAW